MKNIIIVCIIAAFLSGCGRNYQFRAANRLAGQKYYVQASEMFVEIYQKYRDKPIGVEALYRAAQIYQKDLRMYPKAKMYFNMLIKDYPNVEPWVSLAKQELLNSPDYFPLTDSSFWIEGDSNTGGQNMLSEWSCKKARLGTFKIVKRLSAGNSFVTNIEKYYKKENLEVREYDNPDQGGYTAILSYPFIAGARWKTFRDNMAVSYQVVATDVDVKVKAGEFKNCLKVSENYVKLPNSLKYNYYAPNVGWLMTTVAVVGGSEHRNSELISYKINPAKDTDAGSSDKKADMKKRPYILDKAVKLLSKYHIFSTQATERGK